LALKKKSSDPSQQGARRVIAFIGSPLYESQEELETLGAKLKKNNISCDVISFGEERDNEVKLEAFLAAVNSDDKSSHLVSVPPGPHLLSDVLLNSPVIVTEGEIPQGGQYSSGGGFDMGMDAQNDPELAMALRMSMEEEQRRLERLKQEKDGKKEDKKPQPTQVPQFSQNLDKMEEEEEVDEDLQAAINLSMQPPKAVVQDKMVEEFDKDLYEDEDFDEEEALKRAMELSKKQPEKDEKISDILQDEDFLNSVINTLPKDEKKKDEKKDEKK
jgi:26S proteasome regulatory subunit N10